MAIAKKRTAQISKKIPQAFYEQDTTELARALLGKTLVHVVRGKRYAGKIVETEAYLGVSDPACHTWKGRRTDRVNSMYLPGGHAYVYMVYGMHFCFNIVAKKVNEPEAVLIRAIEPLENLEKANTRGPGRLCKALRITKAHDGIALNSAKIFLEHAELATEEAIVERPRIGIDYSGEAMHWPLRFYLAGNEWVSRK